MMFGKTRRLACVLALIALCIGSAMVVPTAQAARTASVTTELDHGVTCTTYSTVVGYPIAPDGITSLHTIVCDHVVGRLQVNGNQIKYGPEISYPASAVCTNASTCSVTIHKLNGFSEGEWIITTSGLVGTSTNQLYYGVSNTAYNWVSCSLTYCTEGEPF